MLAKSAEKSINKHLLFEINHYKKVSEIPEVFLNCTLVGDPVLKDDYLVLPFDGSFLSNIHEKYEAPFEQVYMPIANQNDK